MVGPFVITHCSPFSFFLLSASLIQRLCDSQNLIKTDGEFRKDPLPLAGIQGPREGIGMQTHGELKLVIMRRLPLALARSKGRN